nr:MAG TPA: hypothetical protein [Caudoviricetes sp.]
MSAEIALRASLERLRCRRSNEAKPHAHAKHVLLCSSPTQEGGYYVQCFRHLQNQRVLWP